MWAFLWAKPHLSETFIGLALKMDGQPQARPSSGSEPCRLQADAGCDRCARRTPRVCGSAALACRVVTCGPVAVVASHCLCSGRGTRGSIFGAVFRPRRLAVGDVACDQQHVPPCSPVRRCGLHDVTPHLAQGTCMLGVSARPCMPASGALCREILRTRVPAWTLTVCPRPPARWAGRVCRGGR